MRNLKDVIKNIKAKDIIFAIIMITFARSLRYLFLCTFNFPLPSLYEEPLHLYRLLYLLIIKGFSLVLKNIWLKIGKYI